MMRLRWHRQALDDLRDISECIAQENPAAARRAVSFIRAQATLARHAGTGYPDIIHPIG
jgi:plasmid stabilization system protein ParE